MKARCENESKTELTSEFCVHLYLLLSFSIMLIYSSLHSYRSRLVLVMDVSGAAIERYTMWATENPGASIAEQLEEIRSIQTFNGLSPADRIIIYMGSTFSDDIISANKVSSHKPIFAALVPGAIQQRHLIAACEWFCGTKYPQLLKFFPVLLKHLYDEELLEEGVILEWAADYTRNEFSSEQSLINLETLEQLKSAAKPFIHWLQEAEEDGDDEEDEEEGEEEEAKG